MKKNKIKVYFWILQSTKITMSEKLICVIIHDYAQKNRYCTLQAKQISDILYIPYTTVIKKIKKLIKQGFIQDNGTKYEKKLTLIKEAFLR